MITAFKKYLTTLKLSPVSRKLYLADISRFLSTLGSNPSLKILSDATTYSAYLNELKTLATAPSMLKRTSASLRQFGQFIATTYSLPNPTDSQTSRLADSPIRWDYIKHFINYLIAEHLSPLTIKSYKSDITRYLDWTNIHLAGTEVSQLLKDKSIKKYLNHLRDSLSVIPSTIDRKEKSLERFKDWYSNVYTPTGKPDNIRRGEVLSPDISKNTMSPARRGGLSSALATPGIDQIFVKKWNYRSLLTVAILLLFTASLSVFSYRQFSKDVRLTAAYPSTPVSPNRQLSFQGRLENAGGTPITTATNLTFKLFDAASAGTQLYTTGTCSITPDSDGVFSTQIGSTCGSAITSSVFTENQNVWLEVTVAAETLSPRQQIATVAYALNSETLQGFPLSSTVSAIRNTVVPMNQWGEIIVGEQSPRLKGVSGTFQISAPALTFTTTSGSNGNITLAPDGTGQINVNGNTTSTNFFNISNAQLTTGSLITGTVGNANTGFKLIDLLSGVSPTSKFSVTAAGNVTLAGDLTITGDDLFLTTNTSGYLLVADGTNFNPVALSGDITIDGTGASSIGADKVVEADLKAVDAASDEECLTYETTTGDFEWQSCSSGGGSSNWRYNLGTLSPLNDTIDLLVGGNATSSARAAFLNINSGTPTASVSAGLAGGAFFTADGTLSTTARQSLTLGNSSTYNTTGNILLNPNGTGNVGIGNTTPNQLLELSKADNPSIRLSEASSTTSYSQIGDTSATQFLIQKVANSGIPDIAIDPIATDGVSAASVRMFRNTNTSGRASLDIYLGTNTNTANSSLAGTGNSYLNVNNGNVGIGTTGPDAKLDSLALTEQLRLTYTNGTVYSSFTTNSGGDLTIAPTGGDVAITGDLAVNGATSADITSSTTTATIFNSGVTTLSLGGAATTLNIGPTGSTAGTIVMAGGSADTGCTIDDSTGAITCSGAISTTATTGTQGWWTRTSGNLSPTNLNDTISATTSAAVALTLTQTGAFNALLVQDAAGDTTPFVIDQSGSVGIGTSAPAYKLQIHEPTAQVDLVLSTNNNVGAGNATVLSFISDLDGTPAYSSIGQVSTADLRFSAIGNLVYPDMLIRASDGNVGIGIGTAIGSITPNQKLTVWGGDGSIWDPTDLGTESLTNGNLTSGTSWTQTTDCALATDKATCTFAAGTASTIQQASGTLAVPGVGSRWYQFVYTVSGVTGTPTANITTSFASATTALTLTNGTKNMYFQSATTPTDFIITTTLTAGQAFTLDTFSLKEVQGGDLALGGILTGGGTTGLKVLSSGNVGIGDTTPAALFTVGNGDLFQVNSSGIIAKIDNVSHTIDDVGGNLTLTSNSSAVDIADDLGVNGATSADITSSTTTATVFNSTVTTLSLGGAATTLNISPTGSGASSIVLAGGSADTGCTINGATGDLTCTGAITGSSSGSLFTDSGTVTYLTSTSDDFAIGGSTLAASMFGIDESAGDFFFGYDNSANPTLKFEATDADAGEFGFNTNDAFYFSNANVGIGNIAPGAKLDITADSTNSASNFYGLNLAGTQSVANSSGYFGISSAPTYTAGSGTLAAMYGLYSKVSNTVAGGTITSAYGLYLDDSTETGTITNDYGIYQVDTGALNYFGGIVQSQKYEDAASSSYYLDPASTGTSLSIDGNIVGNGVFYLSTGNDANAVSIGTTGAGKLDAGTIDPPYTINGDKFATYLASMTGVKEETTGVIQSSEYLPGVGYRATLDLASSPEGSDIWLFTKVSNLKNQLDKLVVLLSASGNTKTWYEIDAIGGKLYLYSQSPTTISYRLTAPRFDSLTWLNTRDDSSESIGHVINDASGWSVPESIAALFSPSSPELLSPIAPGESITLAAPLIISPPQNSTSSALTVDGELDAATISARVAYLGDIKADTITARNIVADTISANHIEGLDLRIESSITDRIKARLSELSQSDPTAADLPVPPESTSSALVPDSYILNSDTSIASDSALLSSLDADFVIINSYLAVVGSATITTLDVTANLYANNISSKSNLLAIQPLGGIINLADNTLIVDSSGQVGINGDLTVSGKIIASELNLERLNIFNELGEAVATIDASGSANLASLTTNMITIAASSDATSSANLLTSNISSNATAGESVLISPNTELTIESPYVTANSLVYLTPTGNTDNKVVFVKSKYTCDKNHPELAEGSICTPSFTVAIDAPATSDISFNWWIIQLKP